MTRPCWPTSRANAGKTYPLYINGEERFAEETFASISPTDTDLVMGYFQKGTEKDANDAIAAAKAAYPGWRDTPWQERITLLRRAADLLSERLFKMGAVMEPRSRQEPTRRRWATWKRRPTSSATTATPSSRTTASPSR